VLGPRAQCQLTLSFPPNSSRQKENLPQNPRLLLSESERHREGERDVRVGATRRTRGAAETEASMRTRRRRAVTRCSRSSRSSSGASRPTRTCSPTGRASFTTPSLSSSTWKTSMPSTPTSPPCSVPPPPTTCPW
jgi:hypothetical protein